MSWIREYQSDTLIPKYAGFIDPTFNVFKLHPTSFATGISKKL